MRSPKLFFKRCLCRQALPLALVALSAIAPLPVSANETPKSNARPVARLLSSSREEAASRQRARVIAGYRAVTVSTASARPAAVAAATRSESRLFQLINEERRTRGRGPLVWDGELTRMARYHSENMSRQGFLNHTDRDGLDLTGRAALLNVRGWRALAENIAYNQGFDDPEAFAVERWMLSDKHRANILNGDYTHAGLGVSRSADGKVYFTQVFMKR
jgi:uncharacterized protein YkwD